MAAARDATEASRGASRPNEQPNGNVSDLVSRSASPLLAEAVGRHSITAFLPHHAAFPEVHEILGYVEIFFSSTASLFPYLYKPTILQYLEHGQTSGFHSLLESQMCILNMIMALACVFGNLGSPIEDQIRKGNEFLNRALGLLPHWMTPSANLETGKDFKRLNQFYANGGYSAKPASDRTVPPRHPQVYTDLDFPRGSRQCGPPDRNAQAITPGASRCRREGGVQENVVDVPHNGRVSSGALLAFTTLTFGRMCSMTLGRPPLIPNDYMQIPLPRDIELSTLALDGQEGNDNTSPSDTSKAFLFVQIAYDA
jgi:hypothetical protein